MKRPTRESLDGRIYLDLRRLAKNTSRPTTELIQLYVLEGVLERLAMSNHQDRLVLKGGSALAAFDARRPTRDIDLSATGLENSVDAALEVVRKILSAEAEDGIRFDLDSLASAKIREHDEYSGVRVTLIAYLSTARIHAHVDINVGDPIWPEPREISLPRLLTNEPIRILAYPVEMILAEKIVTAIQRGNTNTRWRDFVDIGRLKTTQALNQSQLAEATKRVALHRQVQIEKLTPLLVGFGAESQKQWTIWRRNQNLEQSTPEQFADQLQEILPFIDELAETLGA